MTCWCKQNWELLAVPIKPWLNIKVYLSPDNTSDNPLVYQNSDTHIMLDICVLSKLTAKWWVVPQLFFSPLFLITPTNYGHEQNQDIYQYPLCNEKNESGPLNSIHIHLLSNRQIYIMLLS